MAVRSAGVNGALLLSDGFRITPARTALRQPGRPSPPRPAGPPAGQMERCPGGAGAAPGLEPQPLGRGSPRGSRAAALPSRGSAAPGGGRRVRAAPRGQDSGPGAGQRPRERRARPEPPAGGGTRRPGLCRRMRQAWAGHQHPRRCALCVVLCQQGHPRCSAVRDKHGLKYPGNSKHNIPLTAERQKSLPPALQSQK